MRIEICGGIASGKTTLARLLRLLPAHTVLERFRENPFWRRFYENPGAHAFETELTFLLQHYHGLKAGQAKAGNVVADYSFVQDSAYAAIGLGKSQKAAFDRVMREVTASIGEAGMLIHLVCSPESELERIRRRGREVEVRITVDFLRSLNEAIADGVRKAARRTPVVTIDSVETNFATNSRHRRALLDDFRLLLNEEQPDRKRAGNRR